MLDRKTGLDWISDNEAGQRDWIENYLTARKLYPKFGDFANAKELKASISRIDADDLRRMKNAWNQKKLRDTRTEKKAFNFVLSISTKQKLRELAKASKYDNVTACLESLIHDTSTLQKTLQDEQKQIREKFKAAQQDKQNTIEALGQLLGYALNELSIHILQLDEAKKTCPQPPLKPQECDIEEIFKKEKIKAFNCLSHGRWQRLNSLGGFIKRPTLEQTQEPTDSSALQNALTEQSNDEECQDLQLQPAQIEDKIPDQHQNELQDNGSAEISKSASPAEDTPTTVKADTKFNIPKKTTSLLNIKLPSQINYEEFDDPISLVDPDL